MRKTALEKMNQVNGQALRIEVNADDRIIGRSRSKLQLVREAESSWKPSLVVDAILGRFRGLAEDLERRATDRREETPNSDIVDLLKFAARLVRETVDEVDAEHEYITPEIYANLYSVTPQTVRNWIRNGGLDATQGTRGWLIKRNAQRKQKEN